MKRIRSLFCVVIALSVMLSGISVLAEDVADNNSPEEISAAAGNEVQEELSEETTAEYAVETQQADITEEKQTEITEETVDETEVQKEDILDENSEIYDEVEDKAFSADDIYYDTYFGTLWYNMSGAITLVHVSAGTNVVIPEIINGITITRIEENAFMIVSASSIQLPSTIESIGSFAFYGCQNLKSIVIPPKVKVIEGNTFSRCDSLESVTFPVGIESVNKYAFTNSNSIKEVYCKKGSAADDKSLYPTGTVIKYITDDSGTPVVPSDPSDPDSGYSDSTEENTSYDLSPVKFTAKSFFGGKKVTFSCDEKGAVIYYSKTSSKLNTNSLKVENGGTVDFDEYYYGTVYAKAYVNGKWTVASKYILKIPDCKEPIITVNNNKATLTCVTPQVHIYYTLDGTDPSPTNGKRITGGRGTIDFTGGKLKAIAARSSFASSSVVTKEFPVAKPKFTVKGVFGGRTVTLTSDTPGARIYYSTTTSKLTTADKSVANGETMLYDNFYGTIYARAYLNGVWSDYSCNVLRIPVIKKPEFTLTNGRMKIYTDTPNCYIYYTTDGTTPSRTHGKLLTSKSTAFTSAPNGSVIKAIAVRSCFTNSDVLTFTSPYRGTGAFSTSYCGTANTDKNMDLGDVITFYNSRRPISSYYAYTWDVEEGEDLVLIDRDDATCRVIALAPGKVRIKTTLQYTIEYTWEHVEQTGYVNLNISNKPGDPSKGTGLSGVSGLCYMCNGRKTITMSGAKITCFLCNGTGYWYP